MQLVFLLLSILPFLLSSFRLTKVKYATSRTSLASTEFSARSYNGGRAGSAWSRDDRRPQRDFGDRGGSRYSERGGGYGGRGGGGYGGRGGRPRMDQTATLRFANTIKIDPNIEKKVDEMGFSEKTLRVLKEKGFESLTPVQTQSYSIVYEGQDVVARSRTGTGKTFAFGLPLVEKLVADGVGQLSSRDLPLVLVLEPTRELCIQVAHELGTLCSAHRLRTQAIYGGASFSMQERAMRSGVHIIVATPGRCLDHISRGTLKLENVKHVVLDEGDTMLEMGFQKDVESIIANVKSPGEESMKKAQKALQDTQSAWRDRDFDDSDVGVDEDDDEDEDSGVIDKKGKRRDVQMLLYSATMPGWICKLTDKHMIDPTFLDAVQEGETRLAQTIEHVAIRLPPIYDRVEAVSAFAEDILLTKGTGGQTIVFTNTKEEADRLAASDCFGQFKTQVIHGDIGQNSRQTIIKQFREKKIEVLVATDVAARGLDIAGVDLVVHVSPPMDADTYVHRSGRTGRAGRNGTSVMLYTENESRKLYMYENSLNFKFVRSGPPSANQISEACATFASKRLENVDKNTVKHFLPHAKRVIDEILNPEVLSNEGADVDTSSPKELIEFLLAKCIAAISNRQTITSRSMLTGEENLLTLQVQALFKNGTSPDNVRDWQRLFNGVLRKSFAIEDAKFGKMNMARGEDRNLCILIDLPYEQGRQVLDMLEREEAKLPQGVSIEACDALPQLVQERYGDRGGYSGGGGYGGGRNGGGGYRGGSSYGGGRDRGENRGRGGGGDRDGGRPWSRGGDRGN